jgi:DNA-binding transcriptional LysR family regulator
MSQASVNGKSDGGHFRSKLRLSAPATHTENVIPQETHLNVRYLEVIWAVVRTGSQHEAGRLLGLSQPAISKIVRYTEDRIGVSLFHRTRGRLCTTPEGNIFFKVIDDIFSRLEGVERLARDLQSRISGLIILGTIPSLAEEFVPQVLGDFMKSHPLLKLNLKVLPPSQVVERVATEQADIGLDFGPVSPGSVETHRLCLMPIVCGFPRGHRLARRDRITLQDLADEPLISTLDGPGWGALLKAAFQQAGVRPNPAIVCTQSMLAFALAKAGAGTAVVPLVPQARDLGADIRICPLSPRIDIELLAVTSRSHPMSKPIALLIDRLQQASASQANQDHDPSPAGNARRGTFGTADWPAG